MQVHIASKIFSRPRIFHSNLKLAKNSLGLVIAKDFPDVFWNFILLFSFIVDKVIHLRVILILILVLSFMTGCYGGQGWSFKIAGVEEIQFKKTCNITQGINVASNYKWKTNVLVYRTWMNMSKSSSFERKFNTSTWRNNKNRFSMNSA